MALYRYSLKQQPQKVAVRCDLPRTVSASTTFSLTVDIVQVFDTLDYKEQKCIEGGFRKIDSIAVYENLIATAESQSIRYSTRSSGVACRQPKYKLATANRGLCFKRRGENEQALA